MKHTPGPWRVAKGVSASEPCVWCSREHGAGAIFIAGTHKMHGTQSEREANVALIAATPDMFVALAKLLCPECEHELQHHVDKYGCQIERGDGYRHAEFEETLGLCGCNEDDLRDDYPDFVRAIAAFKKARGEQFTNF